MTGAEENINKILSDATNNLRVPFEVAQFFLRIGAQLARHQEEIASLRQQGQRLEGHVAQLKRRIERLEGVHGA